MNTVIVYQTKYGCTKMCSEDLKDKLEGRVDLFTVDEIKNSDMSIYDQVIIGSPVYMGMLDKNILEFCKENLTLLQSKKIGLFTCAMRDDEEAMNQIQQLYPKELTSMAVAKANFGGRYVFKSMNFFEKMIIRLLAKSSKDQSTVSYEAIEKFAKKMSSQ